MLVVVMTVLALFGGFGFGGGGIAHFAHLGGFLGGWLYLRWAAWSSPAARFQRRAATPAVRAGDLERWRRTNREDLHPVNRAEFDRVMAKLEAARAGEPDGRGARAPEPLLAGLGANAPPDCARAPT